MYKINFEKPVHVHFIGIGGISMSPDLIIKNPPSQIIWKSWGPKYSTDRKLLILFPASMLLYILPQFILITKNSQKL